MARLPTPGQDEGTWGNILNEYLLESHASDGSLKSGIVGGDQLAENAISAAAIQAGAVTSDALAPEVAARLDDIDTKQPAVVMVAREPTLADLPQTGMLGFDTTSKRLYLNQAGILLQAAAFEVPGLAPTTITGLVAWYDAADTTTVWADTAGTSPAAADGSAVARWDDKSGNGRHALQVSATSRPVINLAARNGLPVLYFDGVDNLLTTPINPSVDMSEGFTIMAVAMLDDAETRTYTWLYGSGSGSPGGLLFGKTGNRDVLHIYATGWHNGVDVAPPGGFIGEYHLFGYQESDSASRVQLDGEGIFAELNSNASMSGTNFFVGAGPSNDLPWKGPIAELVIYNRALTPVERQHVETYLLDKWGL